MTPNDQAILCLDIGERRIGVAWADKISRLAQPLTTLLVDGTELKKLGELIARYKADRLVVGLPRNLSGEETKQSAWIREYVAKHLVHFELPILFQDESVTSVLAEQQLEKSKKAYKKADIDAYAAMLILEDYLGAYHG